MADIALGAFLDSGVAMLGASADTERVPECFRIWGATHDPASDTVRALISSDAGRTLVSVVAGSRLSFTFTDIRTFRSLQVKGSATGSPQPAGPDDLVIMRRYGQAFTRRLGEIGHPGALGRLLAPEAVFVLALAVDERFDQTPGPRAGAPVDAVAT